MNKPPVYDDYEIHAIDRHGNNLTGESEEFIKLHAHTWSVFGHLPTGGIDCIADFYYKESAFTYHYVLKKTVPDSHNPIGEFMAKK